MTAYVVRALRLVWETDSRLAVLLATTTLILGAVPLGIAVVGREIVNGVVRVVSEGDATARSATLAWLVVELAIVTAGSVAERGRLYADRMLQVLLGQRVMELILQKASSLSLANLEEPTYADRLREAREGATYRPLSLVQRAFSLLQGALSIAGFGALLVAFSPWALLLLAGAALPAFLVEARFNRDAFTLFRWSSPTTRKRYYIERLLTRLEAAREVVLFRLAKVLLPRQRQLFETVFLEERALARRRALWGLGVGLVGQVSLYGAFAWVAVATLDGKLSVGSMTMYLLVFKQAQGVISSTLKALAGMYDDHLYVTTLYEFLELPSDAPCGEGTAGPSPGDGLRLDGVTFQYPNAERPAVDDVSLHIPPGTTTALVGANGSGKSTLVKLLLGLYQPQRGTVTLDGLSLAEWDPDALARRMSCVFQDHVRYQFIAGESVGAGDVDAFEDRAAWERATDAARASEVIQDLPKGFDTQLGRWFDDGAELSGGQWQSIALARGFMRPEADIVMLDEPTAALDAAAERQVFDLLQSLAAGRTAILVSHRFSTVRAADRIAVLERGKLVELGSHEALIEADGAYARSFALQAEAYQRVPD